MTQHQFGRLMFCTRCGAAMQDAFDDKRPRCLGAPNVVAVSELIAARRMRALFGPLHV